MTLSIVDVFYCSILFQSYEAAIDSCTQALDVHRTADALLLRSRIKRDQK
jgi:hypothetical protein